MSGSSHDGVDIAYCEFVHKKGKWNYTVPFTITYNYSESWKNKLLNVYGASARELARLDNEYGMFLGKILSVFIRESKLKPDFIASHGHTIFHQPESHFSTQIGKGAPIASLTKLPVINDFRSADMAKGGQGAPLVPIGDKLLFGDFDFCLNLGGIANISFDDYNGSRVASDIVPCNMGLNYLASHKNKTFDDDGKLARKGKVDMSLLEELNGLDYYWTSGAGSLGREWFEKYVVPPLNRSQISTEDKLATFAEHIAYQIGKIVSQYPGQSLLISGGGAYNSYLVERITEAVTPTVNIPEQTIIDYKEAIIFAFLGVLRRRKEVNILKTVTGASCDSVGGVVWVP